jgi:hypothetical protein
MISGSSVQILTSSGHPVDPSKLTDFELSSIMLDPTADNYEVQAEHRTWDAIAMWWNNLLAGPFGTIFYWIITILIVIGVIVVASKFKRRSES